ncbi:MAG: preprotein translocase subunit SecE [Planctomycetes bacterium]|nr:preprotein translocase subunit SecE [Planctomycetota bacterium]
MWRIYKEGQGKWARGLTAFVIAITAIFAVASLHDALPVREPWTIPVVNWSFDYRWVFEAPVLVAALICGVWLYNRRETAEFLIETENELKTKVTWPSRREEVNASTVVVVTVLLVGILIFSVDSLLAWVQGWVFTTPKGTP